MKKLSGQLSAFFALVMVIIGWSGWFILKAIAPESDFTWYPYIPAVFMFMGTALIAVLAANYKMEAKKLVNLYMVIKLLKLVMAMVYILTFYFVVGKDLRFFGFTFAAFYAVYIGLETLIFYFIEKQIKKEQ